VGLRLPGKRGCASERFRFREQPWLDLAVFCHSSDDYLTLALALRKKLRNISSIIPIDLVPIAMPYGPSAAFMQEINKGEVVYEKKVKSRMSDKRGALPWLH
jgi:hypothetical protein